MKTYVKAALLMVLMIIVIFVLVLTNDKPSNEIAYEPDIIHIPIVDDSQTIDEVSTSNDPTINIEISPESSCIYDPGNNAGYRYGPTLLINDDGSIDAWFSRPGNNSSMWDYICYRHMDIDGNWSDEQIVLKPTPGSKDCYSVCDPGVIYYDGYYYIGYTGTCSQDGLRNQVFVARSDKPNGTYEKWNGSSWGGSPEPIIKYEGEYWGVGEISFVKQADEEKMFCYYSYKSGNEDSTRVSKVDLVEDWPLTIRYRGVSFRKDPEECSSDVVYLKDKNIYLAFSIGKRMSKKSRILVHYSYDGKYFEFLDEYKDVIEQYAHNMGISKHLDGHIELTDNLFIAYAYSNDNKWGRWKTNMHEIEIK